MQVRIILFVLNSATHGLNADTHVKINVVLARTINTHANRNARECYFVATFAEESAT